MATAMPRSRDIVDNRLITGRAPAVVIVHLALACTRHVIHLLSEWQLEEVGSRGFIVIASSIGTSTHGGPEP